MKRKIFSAVLALVMLLTLAPVAFAAEDEDEPVVILPDGTKVVGIPTIDAPEMALSAEETVIPIPDEDAFAAITASQWTSGATFEIQGDLNLEQLYIDGEVPNYYGLINFFYGTIRGVWLEDEGRYPIIKGIPSAKCLIRLPIGGTIENLIFDHGTNTPYITFLAGAFTNQVHTLTLNNITVQGNGETATRVGSNYSPFVYTCPAGGIIMNNCVNKINMVGSGYSSVFFGYYPAYYSEGHQRDIEFINCTNYGNLTTNMAGMFFGNSTGLDNYIGDIKLVIENCVNNGSILGRNSAYYLCAAAANEGEFSDGSTSGKIEDVLVKGSESPYAAQFEDIQKITGTPNVIGKAPTLEGFSAIWNSDNTISFTPATNNEEVAYYRVRVGSYLHAWDTENNKFFGTYLYTVEQRYNSDAVTGMESVKAELMAYGFADSDYGPQTEVVLSYPVCDVNGEKFYFIQNTDGNIFQYYATGNLNDEGTPVDNMAVPPAVVIVTAYGVDNNTLQAIWLTKPEVQ